MREHRTFTVIVVGMLVCASNGLAIEVEKSVSEIALLKGLPLEGTGPTFNSQQKEDGFALWWADHAAPFYATIPPSKEDLTRKAHCQTPPGEHEPLILGVWGLRDLASVVLSVKESPFPVTIMTAYYDEREVPAAPAEGRRRLGIPSWLPKQATSSVKAGRNTVFWVDLKVPVDAKPDSYEGSFSLMVDGENMNLPFTVEVLPIELPPADIAFGLYFRSHMPYMPKKEYITRELIDAYDRDMAEHDHTSAVVYNPGEVFHNAQGNVALEGKPGAAVIDRMMKNGLVRPEVPMIVIGGIDQDAGESASVALAAAAKERGWPELLIYAPDEPVYRGPRSKACIEAVKELQSLRPALRLVTAIWHDQALYFAKDLDVWIVPTGSILPRLRARCREVGAEMWTYDAEHRGTNPTFHRFQAGLYTWGLQLKGNFLWCYTEIASWEGDRSSASPFNHVLLSLCGPVSSVAWEARREGIEDYRSLSTLEKLVAKKPQDARAMEAAHWLEELRGRVNWRIDTSADADDTLDARDILSLCPNFRPSEFNEIRSKAREYLMRLSEQHTD